MKKRRTETNTKKRKETEKNTDENRLLHSIGIENVKWEVQSHPAGQSKRARREKTKLNTPGSKQVEDASVDLLRKLER